MKNYARVCIQRVSNPNTGVLEYIEFIEFFKTNSEDFVKKMNFKKKRRYREISEQDFGILSSNIDNVKENYVYNVKK